MQNNKTTKKKKIFLITHNETIALFIFTALIFATLYFVQLYITNERIRDVIEYSDSKIASILVVDSDNYSLSSTNKSILNKKEFENTLSSALDNHRNVVNEDIKQIIKNNSDVVIFWLSFTTVIILVFSIFTINITKDYAEKTRIYSKNLQKKIDKDKNFGLNFMVELVKLSNQTRDICLKSIDDITKVMDSILELKDIDKLRLHKEEFEDVKKDVIADIEKSIKTLKEENLFSFDEEITNKYNTILKSIKHRKEE